MASTKRCHYEVLGLPRDCTADEIRAAYRKLALQRHPDKLIQSGLTQAEATAQFQELAQAYEVLSDPKERSWYDSHRSQILFSDPTTANDSVSTIPNLFSFFSNTVFSGYGETGKGFYKVYSDVFDRIYKNEISYCRKLGLGLENLKEAPLMGNLSSPYEQVSAFYGYWMGFSTVMDFYWVDQYDVMAGPNRKSRRVMEEENKKLRRKAKREFNETVRGLAEFVKKRDKRVIDMMVKKNAEMEKRKEEERERRRKAEKERMERMRAYEEPEWTKVNEEEFEEIEDDVEEKKGSSGKELYCVVCGKKFKSEKQWKNHEQSKKHKEKVAELRESFVDEDEEMENIEVDEEGKNGEGDDTVDEIEEMFKEDFTIREEENRATVLESSDEANGFFDAEDAEEDSDDVERVGKGNGIDHGDVDGDEDDDGRGESSLLEAMLSGHRSRKNRGLHHAREDAPAEVHLDLEKEDDDDMVYNNRKSRRRKGKKERGKNNVGKPVKIETKESKSLNEGTTEHINGQDDEQMVSATSHSFTGDGPDADISIPSRKTNKSSAQSVDKKGVAKKEINTKSKNSSKEKKGKAASKNYGNVCEKCGEEFESRTKLHKHLTDTGHASLKYR